MPKCLIFSMDITPSLSWHHYNRTEPDTKPRLLRAGIDELIVEALLADETRPRLVETDTGLLLILRGINLNQGAEPEDMVSLRLYVTETSVVSVEFRKVMAVRTIADDVSKGVGPKTAGDFLTVLTAVLYKRMEPVIDELGEELDVLEEAVITSPTAEERQSIVDIRKRAIVFRRYISPQRDLVHQLKNADKSWVTDRNRRNLQETGDRLIRYLEEVDAIRERAQIVKDELVNSLSDKLNRNLYILSVITAVFLPLGFLTGLFGVNVGGMPGLDSPLAFYSLVGGMVGLLLVQIVMFRRLRWF